MSSLSGVSCSDFQSGQLKVRSSPLRRVKARMDPGLMAIAHYTLFELSKWEKLDTGQVAFMCHSFPASISSAFSVSDSPRNL